MSHKTSTKKEKKPFYLYDYIIHGIYFTIYGIVKYFPSPIGDIFRYWFTKPFIKKMGKVRIYEGVTIWYPYRIKLGNDITFNEYVYISGYGQVEIGNGVRIGHRTSIISSDHVLNDTSTLIKDSGIISQKVRICDDVYIGCNVTILKGVTIGRGSVVGAGAVVCLDVEEYTVVAGVPARPVSKRTGTNQRIGLK